MESTRFTVVDLCKLAMTTQKLRSRVSINLVSLWEKTRSRTPVCVWIYYNQLREIRFFAQCKTWNYSWKPNEGEISEYLQYSSIVKCQASRCQLSSRDKIDTHAQVVKIKTHGEVKFLFLTTIPYVFDSYENRLDRLNTIAAANPWRVSVKDSVYPAVIQWSLVGHFL